MNFKKAISAISALAISVSCFAGLAVTSHAEATQENATKYILASWGYNNATKTDTHVYKTAEDDDFATTEVSGGVGPSTTSNNYPAAAAVQFTFLNADNATIAKAELSFKVKIGGNTATNRTYSMYTVEKSNANLDIPYGSTSTDPYNGFWEQTSGSKWTYTNIFGQLTSVLDRTNMSGPATHTETAIDVTEYVAAQTKQADNKYYVTFILTNANAGGTLQEPTLTITYADASAVEKDITVNYKYSTGSGTADIPSASIPANATKTATVYSGTSYTVESYPASFEAVEDEHHYRYTYAGSDGDDTIASVDKDSDNVINLVYTRAELTNFVVNAVNGEGTVLKQISSEYKLPSEFTSYSYPKYLTDENHKVTATCTQSTFTQTVEDATQASTYTVTYTPYTGNEMWFFESEDSIASHKGETANAAASGGKYAGSYAYGNGNRGDELFTVPKTGLYKITIYAFTSYETFLYNGAYDNSNVETNRIFNGGGRSTGDSSSKENIELTEGQKIRVVGQRGDSNSDYILFERTGDLPVDVAAPTEVAETIALTSPTGAVGAPVFANIESELTGRKMIKFVVTNPLDNVYPKVAIKGTDYQLDENTVTAIPGAGNTVAYYLEFKAKTTEDLADFGTVTVSYGSGENTDSATFDFAAE